MAYVNIDHIILVDFGKEKLENSEIYEFIRLFW